LLLKKLSNLKKTIPIEKITENIHKLVLRLQQGLEKDQFFFGSGTSGQKPEKLTKQELVDEHYSLLFHLKSLNDQYIKELLYRIDRENSLIGRTGPLRALRIDNLTHRQWIRLAMLRFNGVPDTLRMPHLKIANIPSHPIEPPQKKGKDFISKIKPYLIEVIEVHLGNELTLSERDIVLRIDPKNIRDMLKILN